MGRESPPPPFGLRPVTIRRERRVRDDAQSRQLQNPPGLDHPGRDQTLVEVGYLHTTSSGWCTQCTRRQLLFPQSPTSNLLDDMYFGDSADSVGIQAADMCAFLVRRHLAGKQDSEWPFKIIEPHISGSIWPE